MTDTFWATVWGDVGLLLVALVSGGIGVMATIWRFSRKSQKYDDALDDLEKLDAKMDQLILDVKMHIAGAESDDKGLRREFDKLEQRVNRRFNGSGDYR